MKKFLFNKWTLGLCAALAVLTTVNVGMQIEQQHQLALNEPSIEIQAIVLESVDVADAAVQAVCDLSVAPVEILTPATVHAAVDTDITAMTDDATSVFGNVKTLVKAIVGFFILLGIVKLVRRR